MLKRDSIGAELFLLVYNKAAERLRIVFFWVSYQRRKVLEKQFFCFLSILQRAVELFFFGFLIYAAQYFKITFLI